MSIVNKSAVSYQSKVTKRTGYQPATGHLTRKCSDCSQVERELQQKFNKTDKCKKKNDELRMQLREISTDLDKELEKVNKTQNMNKQIEIDQKKRVETLKEELKNVKKNVKTYGKQSKALETKISGNYDVDRITAMLRVLKNREYELFEVKTENKSLIKLKNDSDRIIAKMNNDALLNQMRDQILNTKTLINEAKRVERINEKGYKKQQEYITKVKTHHELLCEELGVDSHYNVPTKQEMFPVTLNKEQEQKYMQNKRHQQARQSQLNIEKDQQQRSKTVETKRKKLYVSEFEKEVAEDDMDLSQEQFEEFQGQIKKLEDTIEKAEKHQRKREVQKEKIIHDIEKTNVQILALIKQKEEDLKKAQDIIAQLTSIQETSGVYNTNQGYLFNKSQLEINKFRTEQGGLKRGSEEGTSFQDSQLLPDTKDYNINEIRVIYETDYILSLEIEYKLRNGQKKVITCFKNSMEMVNQKLAVLQLKGKEQIQQIIGYYNDTHIEYLKIMSSNRNYLMVGSEKNISKLQKFNLNIKKDDIPISFFGTVDKLPKLKKNKYRQEEYCLISIGVELRKKDYLRSSNYLNKIQSPRQLKSKKVEEEEEEEEEEERDENLEKKDENNDNNNEQNGKVDEDQNDKVQV